MPRDLTMAAARKQGDDRAILRKAVLRAELGARLGSFCQFGQGVADVSGWNAVFLEKSLLKREDTEKTFNSAAEDAHSTFAPGPGLWGDQVHDRHAIATQLLGDAKVEVGGIGEHRDVGALQGNRANKFTEQAVDARDVANHFYESYHCDGSRVDDWADARGLHARAGAAEKFDAGNARAQGR